MPYTPPDMNLVMNMCARVGGTTTTTTTTTTTSTTTTTTTAADVINDTFTTDTSANYTAIGGGISVSGGLAHGTTAWAQNMVYHNTTLGSANHYAQADIKYVGSDKSHVLARIDIGVPKTGYSAHLVSDRVALNKFSGTTLTYITDSLVGWPSDTYTSDTFYTVKLNVNGTTIKVYVGGVEKISVTDSSYSVGNYVGIGMMRGFANYDITVDNLIGNAL
jgi:hypothetical protein